MADDPRPPGAASDDRGRRRGDYGDPVAQVMAQARRHGIYVHECPELVALLMQADLDACISPRVYDVIAEFLVWIQEIDAQAGRSKAPKPR